MPSPPAVISALTSRKALLYAIVKPNIPPGLPELRLLAGEVKLNSLSPCRQTQPVGEGWGEGYKSPNYMVSLPNPPGPTPRFLEGADPDEGQSLFVYARQGSRGRSTADCTDNK